MIGEILLFSTMIYHILSLKFNYICENQVMAESYVLQHFVILSMKKQKQPTSNDPVSEGADWPRAEFFIRRRLLGSIRAPIAVGEKTQFVWNMCTVCQ